MIIPAETLTVTLNGHVVLGLRALDIPDTVEIATVRRGATGDMLASATSKHGGTVSIMLQSGAPSLALFQQQLKVIAGGGIVNWEGSVKDAKHGSVLRLMDGVMTSAPMGPLMDETAEKTFTFEFERLYYEVIYDQGNPYRV